MKPGDVVVFGDVRGYHIKRLKTGMIGLVTYIDSRGAYLEASRDQTRWGCFYCKSSRFEKIGSL